MHNPLWSRVARFLSYVSLTYVEKALIFGFPIFVLYLTGDKAGYNRIEFIFSAAALSAPFFDGSLNIYLLYAYKRSGQSTDLVKPIFASFQLLLKGYLIAVALVSVGVSLWMTEQILNWICIAARTLFLCTITFLATWFRMTSSPARVFIYSIPVYVAGGALIWAMVNDSDALLIALIGPHLFAVVVVAYTRFSTARGSVKDLFSHIGAALQYGWPILASVLISMGLANFGKIYAYGNLSENDMFNFSFAQRIATIVLLIQTAFSGYMSKQLFVSEQSRFHQKTFAVFVITLLIATIVAYCVAWFAPSLGFIKTAPLDSTFTLIIIYMLLKCIGAYLEVYINRANCNILVLVAVILSAVVFITWIIFTHSPMMHRVATSMALSAGTYLAFLVISLFYLAIFAHPLEKVKISKRL